MRIRTAVFAWSIGAAGVLATGGGARADDGKAAYDELIERYKAKDWDAVLDRAPRFLAEHPAYRHAGTARYALGVAQFERRRFGDAAETADRYLEDEPEGKYAERVELLRARSLFKARRGPEAKAALDAFLAARAASGLAASARDWRSRVDPPDRKVEGAVVLDYDGKYAADPRFRARVKEVVRLVPVALQGLAGSLRLPAVPKPRVRVRFQDLGARTGLGNVVTREELHGGAVVQSIVLYTEPLVLDLYDLARTLQHELVHVVHRDRLGEAYYGVPEWVREGMAVWAAGQGPDRLPETYVGEITRPGDVVARLADGLSDPSHDFVDYAEDWLAFDWVERQKGAPVAQTLVRDLLASADWRAAFEKATGMPFPDFEKAALADARARFEKDLAEVASYREARAIVDRAAWKEAAAALEALRTASPRHVATPLVLRDLATAYLELGRFDDAAAAIDACERSQPHGTLRDDVALRRVLLAAKGGKAGEAKRLAEDVLRDFSWKDAKWRDRVRKAAGLPDEAPAADADAPEGAPGD